MREFKISDAWSFSPWTNPPTVQPNIPGVQVPKAPQGPRAPRQKRIVPGLDDLYDIQKDLIKVINSHEELIHKHKELAGDGEFKRAYKNARNAYRILNRYLNKYGEGTNMGF